jgi:hypothetical protein
MGKIVLDVAPYVFGSGVRLQLAVLRKKLVPFVEAFQGVHTDLVKRHVKDEPQADGTAKQVISPQLTTDMNDALKEEHDVSFAPIKASLLNADANNLPSDLIFRLMPILDMEA